MESPKTVFRIDSADNGHSEKPLYKKNLFHNETKYLEV